MTLEELVKLIEDQADDLAQVTTRAIRESPRLSAYHRFSEEDVATRARIVYANLGHWLEVTSEGDVKAEYFELGVRRYGERIPLSQVIWALLLVRRNLWQFVESHGWDTMGDLERTMELNLLVVRFFDRAILHTVSGYESAGEGPKSQTHAEAVQFWPGG
jgi:hypothetical protein